MAANATRIFRVTKHGAPPVVPEARPFLKWAGGKQQLLAQLDSLFPTEIRDYFEPFVGSAAVFFHLRRQGRLRGDVHLADNNADLVNAYAMVRDRVEEVIELLAAHERLHSREHYYRVRHLDRAGGALSPVEAAARLIYLNRTCYNGLYRVNSRGHFNVPIGSYRNPRILFAESLRAASTALSGTELAVQGFEEIVGLAGRGDFVYFDPPYDPVSRTASFTSYTAGSFGDDDQRRLAEVFARLTERGCRCLLSNSHTPLILALYKDYRIEIVKAKRAINSKGSARGQVDEVVVLNFDPAPARERAQFTPAVDPSDVSDPLAAM